MGISPEINKIMESWNKYCLEVTGLTYKQIIRERNNHSEKDEDEEYEVEDELDEENRCGNLVHGLDGKWVSKDKEDGSLTYPDKQGCNNGKQYKRTGSTKGANRTPCGRRDRTRKCKG